jgi:3-dehydroquinate dehydratase type I
VPIVSLSQAAALNGGGVVLTADLFELRIDLVGPKWRDVVPLLKKPWIACNRRPAEGGKWKGPEEKRVKELMSSFDLGASYIDIELGASGSEEIAKEVKGRAQVIISYHDLQETPPMNRLRQIVIDELAAGADICKVVTTVREFRDNITMLELITVFPAAKIISFAMGAAGQVSRVLSPLVGGYLTWASAESGAESAPGQIALEDAAKIYRMLSRD